MYFFNIKYQGLQHEVIKNANTWFTGQFFVLSAKKAFEMTNHILYFILLKYYVHYI